MPWIYGILSLFIISITSCIIIKIYDIEKKYLQILISGIIVSFPSIVGMMSYTYLCFSFSISFLLSVWAVYFMKKGSYIYCLLCLIFSISIYQAYIAVTASLAIICIFQMLIRGNQDFTSIVRNMVFYFLIIITSVISYWLMTKFLLFITEYQFNSYTSERINSDWGIYPRIYWLIINLYSSLVAGTYGFATTPLAKIIHYIFISGIIITVISTQIKQKKISQFLLCLFLIIMYPFAINCIHLVAPLGTHTLTLLSFASIYIFVIIIVQQFYSQHKKIYDFTLILLGLLLINNIFIANKAHLRQYIQHENTQAFYTGIITQIKETPGFDKDSKVALCGKVQNNVYDFSNWTKDDITGIFDGPIYNIYSNTLYIRYYLGFDVPYANADEIKKIQETEEFKEMSYYPYYGSVKKIGNYIVVKFGND